MKTVWEFLENYVKISNDFVEIIIRIFGERTNFKILLKNFNETSLKFLEKFEKI